MASASVIDFCTIVARNYQAQAQVLASDIRAHHADTTVWVLVVDAERGELKEHEGVRHVLPDELALTRSEFHRMAAIYDITELCTAVKPWLLQLVIERNGGPVVYLDPDIRVFAPLDDVVTAPPRGFAVTPHTVRPMPRDGMSPSEIDILLSGAFNLGFIAVDADAIDFLRWWQERLQWDCLHDVRSGYFVDQRWIDLAVHYFPATVLRDESLNVAYWNLDTRRLARGEDGWSVNGRPLRFFHFSGYRPSEPEVLFRYAVGTPRVDPTSDDTLRELLREYVFALLRHGFEQYAEIPYRYAYSSGGLPMTGELQRTLRQHALTKQSPVPDPFDPTQNLEFAMWVRRHHRRSVARRVAARMPEPVKVCLRRMRSVVRGGEPG